MTLLWDVAGSNRPHALGVRAEVAVIIEVDDEFCRAVIKLDKAGGTPTCTHMMVPMWLFLESSVVAATSFRVVYVHNDSLAKEMHLRCHDDSMQFK